MANVENEITSNSTVETGITSLNGTVPNPNMQESLPSNLTEGSSTEEQHHLGQQQQQQNQGNVGMHRRVPSTSSSTINPEEPYDRARIRTRARRNVQREVRENRPWIWIRKDEV